MWKCEKCGELLGAQFDSCWNCGATKSTAQPNETFIGVKQGKTELRASRLNTSPPPDSNGFISSAGIVALLIGIAVFAYGLVRINSFESQVNRFMGGRDQLGMVFLFSGVMIAIFGGLGTFASFAVRKARQQPVASGVAEEDAQSLFDDETNLETHRDTAMTSDSTVDAITQIERLADLKERGALTEEEFLAAKRKILSVGTN